MKARPAAGFTLALLLLLLSVVFGSRLAEPMPSRAAAEFATEIPASIPPDGVNINEQVLLMPPAPTDVPALDRSRAIQAATAGGNKSLESNAVLSRVTVPGTIPPPDSPVPFRTIQDRLAWVVTFTSEKPVDVGVGKAGSSVWVTHYSVVLDAATGEFLIGFYTA